MAEELAVKILGDASNLKGALDTASAQVSKFSDRITAMGKTAVIAGGIVMAAFTKAFLSFADYEQALIDMAKVTDEPFDKIEAKLRELDPILGSSKELIKGYYQVISAGVTDPVRALDTLTVSAKLAKSAHVDQSETVKGLTKIMAGYEGAVESATEAADLLYAIERYGQVQVSELIPIIGGLAKISHTLGINQREMAGAIALGSQTAGSAAEAGVQYEAIMVGLMKPTEAMTKAIEGMGFKTAEAAIKELGFVGVLRKLQETTGGSSEKLAELFGRKEAMLGFTALGAAGFTLLEKNIRGVEAGTGAADEAFFKWSESSQASITGLQNRFKNFIKDVGKVLEEDINKMLDKTSEIIDSIDEWMKTYPDLFSSIVRGTAKLAAWAVILGTVALAIGRIGKIIVAVKEPLLWLVTFFSGIPGMVALAIGLTWATLENFGENVPKWLSGLYDNFNKWWDMIVANTDNKWVLMADKIKEALYTIADYTYLILDPLVDYIREGWNKDYDVTVYWWNKIAEWMYKGLEVIVNLVKDNWYKISYTTSYWWDQISLEVKQTWDRISEIFTTPLADTINNIWNDIKVNTGNIWDDIKLKTEIAWESITGAITDRIDALKDWIKEALPSLAEFISDVWEDIKADAEKIWTDTLEKITDLWDKIKEIFTGKKKGEVVTESKNAGTEAGEALVTGLEESTSPRIKKVMDDLAAEATEAGKKITEGLSEGIISGGPRAEKAMKFITEEKIAPHVRSRSPIKYGVLTGLFDWGKNIPAELGEGITAGGTALGKIMEIVTEKNVKEPLLSVFGTILPEVEKETEKIKDAVGGATGAEFTPIVGLDKVIYDLRILEKQYEEIPKDAEYFTEKTSLLNKEHEILIANLAEAKTKFGEDSAVVLQATVQVIDNENATRRMVKAYEELNKVVPLSTTIIEAAQRANKAITDTIYEFTHLPYEVEIKKINERYDDYIKVVKEANYSLAVQEIMIRNASIARELELEGVDRITEAERKEKEQKDLLAESTKDIKDRILEMTDSLSYNIQKLDEQKEVFEEAGVSAVLIAEWYEKAMAKLVPPDIGPWDTFFNNLREKYKDATGEIQSAISDFVNTAQSALGDLFYNILSGTESFGESIKGFFASIVDAVIKELARLAAFYVFKWIFGIPGLSAGGGAGVGLGAGMKAVKGFQFGGMADTIPARLNIGEYIIAKPMTDFIKRFRTFPANLIDAIAKGMPTPVPAFAGGGPVGTPNITASSFGETKINIDIHDNRIANDVDVKRLAVTISDEVLRKIEMKRRH